MNDEELQCTAGKLINAWVAEKGRAIPWYKAVEIVAIVTKMPDEEKQKLLNLDA